MFAVRSKKDRPRVSDHTLQSQRDRESKRLASSAVILSERFVVAIKQERAGEFVQGIFTLTLCRGRIVIFAWDRVTKLEYCYLEAGNLRLVLFSFDVYGTPILGSSQMYFSHLDAVDNAIA